MSKTLKLLWFSFIFALFFSSFAQKILPREASEPAGLNPVYALDIDSNFKNSEVIPEVHEYHQACSDFVKKLIPLKYNTNYAYLIGHWNLINYEDKAYNETELLDMCNNFFIRKDNGYLYFTSMRPVPLYIGSNNELYFISDWRYILKKLVFSNGHLYIYHLTNDQWILDIIQNNGKYYSK